MQDIAQLIDDCMQSDPAARPTALQIFHRIAGSADASQPIRPLASRSAASSFESGRPETASNPSVQSAPDADAANHITAQETCTDADSEPDVHGNGLVQPHDKPGPAEQADTLPAVKAGLDAGRTGRTDPSADPVTGYPPPTSSSIAASGSMRS